MIYAKTRPAFPATGTTGQYQSPARSIGPPGSECKGFARCRLRGGAIIDRLPLGCPLAADRPLEELLRRRDAAWALFAPGPGQDVGQAVAADRAVSLCETCTGKLLSDPHVSRLRGQNSQPTSRRAAGNGAQRTDRTPPEAEPRTPAPRPMIRTVRMRGRSEVPV